MSRTGSAARSCASISARSSARVRSGSIIRRSRIESLEPTLHFGELRESPGGALLQQRLNGPDYPIGVPRALGGVEEDYKFRWRGDVPPCASHGIAVALKNPPRLSLWVPEEERGQIVAEGAHPRSVPIDEPRPQPSRCGDHEDVDCPQIAVKQRVRPGCLLEDLRPSGRVGEKRDQSLEQALGKPRVLPGGFDRRARELFERRDGVSNVRGEVLYPQASDVTARVRQHGVMSGARV